MTCDNSIIGFQMEKLCRRQTFTIKTLTSSSKSMKMSIVSIFGHALFPFYQSALSGKLASYDEPDNRSTLLIEINVPFRVCVR